MRLESNVRSKHSFFEKKEQKTFVSPPALKVSQVLPEPLWQIRHQPRCRRTAKSFLLLFLEKEGLAYFYNVSPPGPLVLSTAFNDPYCPSQIPRTKISAPETPSRPARS